MPLCARVVQGTARCDAGALASGKPLVPGSFHGQPLLPDPGMQQHLAPALAAVAQAQAMPLGIDVPVTLNRQRQWREPSRQRDRGCASAHGGGGRGLLNTGGLRADLAAGPLTYGHLYETFPFDNAVATLKLTSAELRALLAAILAHGRVPQQSGLRLSVAACPDGLKVLEVSLSDGTSLQDGRLYSVVLPDYLARGGDGLTAFIGTLPAERRDLGERRPQNLRDSLAADLSRRGKPLVAPPPGRTQVVQGKAARCAL